MADKEDFNDDLEEELEKALKKNELKRNIFKILRDEKSAQAVKERRLKKFN